MTLEQSMKLMQVTTPNYQATLDEILTAFNGHKIYGLDENTFICVLDANDNVLVTFESIGYDDDDCVPDLYEVYDFNYEDVKFAEVAHLWGDTITKIQEEVKNNATCN